MTDPRTRITDVLFIEHSAYVTIQAERDEAISLKNKAADIAIALGVEHNRMVKEVGAWKAKYEKAFESYDRHFTAMVYNGECANRWRSCAGAMAAVLKNLNTVKFIPPTCDSIKDVLAEYEKLKKELNP